jgi:hypothetical protein
MYFQKNLPECICTVEEFPNVYSKAVNAPKPDVLGLFSWTGGDKKGAILAPCVDTVNHVYLAARSSLYAITEVYSAGVLVDPANYAVSYDLAGQTLITFNNSQGDNDVTYNGKGYSWPAWDSANGYVQNPAYIIEYFLAFLVGIPFSHIDTAAFDTLAAWLTAQGFGTIGKLALTGSLRCEDYFRQLLYTFGVLAAFSSEGKWTVARKDDASLATYKTVWAQLDTLDHPLREYVTGYAFNRMRAAWDLAPAPNVYQGGQVSDELASQSIVGSVMEPATAPNFPWTDSAAWIAVRTEEELRRYAYGYNKFTFTLPIEWLDEIDLLDNIKLQDMFGVDLDGSGEAGRIIYVESIAPDLERMQVAVTCSDLTWLLSAYLILGDPALPVRWTAAGPEERAFAYLCDTTGLFSDGGIGKKL